LLARELARRLLCASSSTFVCTQRFHGKQEDSQMAGTNTRETSTERNITEEVGAMRDSVKSMIDRGTERATHLKDEVVDKSRDILGAVERAIEHRPLVAIGCAFLGGLVIGRLVMGGRK
jgi:ElaB/YqjD/DUF883 family membrane-anchored ribosome-binding protein